MKGCSLAEAAFRLSQSGESLYCLVATWFNSKSFGRVTCECTCVSCFTNADGDRYCFGDVDRVATGVEHDHTFLGGTIVTDKDGEAIGVSGVTCWLRGTNREVVGDSFYTVAIIDICEDNGCAINGHGDGDGAVFVAQSTIFRAFWVNTVILDCRCVAENHAVDNNSRSTSFHVNAEA